MVTGFKACAFQEIIHTIQCRVVGIFISTHLPSSGLRRVRTRYEKRSSFTPDARLISLVRFCFPRVNDIQRHEREESFPREGSVFQFRD